MNAGQKQFLDFILARVEESDKAAVQQFMENNFEKQDQGTFGLEDIQATKEMLHSKIKPEHAEEVGKVMAQFSSNFAGK